MALDGNLCGTAIANAVTTLSQSDKEDPEKIWQTAMTQLFTHITTNMVVSPAGLPTPLTAPAGGGPVTGTGKAL